MMREDLVCKGSAWIAQQLVLREQGGLIFRGVAESELPPQAFPLEFEPAL